MCTHRYLHIKLIGCIHAFSLYQSTAGHWPHSGAGRIGGVRRPTRTVKAYSNK